MIQRYSVTGMYSLQEGIAVAPNSVFREKEAGIFRIAKILYVN